MSKVPHYLAGVVFLATYLSTATFATEMLVKQPSPGPSVAVAASVEGFCFIGESSTNLHPGPCVNLLLILNDDQGVEVARTRTTSQGMFEFAAESQKLYHVVSGSKFYEVAIPKSVHGGSKINLQLQQK